MSTTPPTPSTGPAPAAAPSPPAAPRAGASSSARMRQVRAAIILPLAALVLAVLIGSVFVYAAAWIKDGKLVLDQPLKAYGALVSGSLLSFDAIVTTLVFTSPLIFGGLAVALGFKAGLFNIGVLGQLLMGVLAAVAVGVALADQPVWIGATLAFVAGTLAGALMGFIPGYLKATTGAHEVVTTIMLNYIAGNILAAFVVGPLRVPRAPAPVTFDVGHSALPIFLGKTGHVGLIIAIVMAMSRRGRMPA